MENDILNVINPQRKHQDQYFFSICPREETSTNGMLLTSATINESLGLLNKLEVGKFGLDVNAMKRKAFVHGDALSCVTHANSKLVIAKKGTVPGNKKLVSDLLGAHSRVIMQEGMFHQLMHQSAVIYIKYYGGFLQAMQVALAIKRILGDPVKGNFQDHDKFIIKMYKVCCRFRLSKFLASVSFADYIEQRLMPSFETTLSLEATMTEYFEEWENSPHEPSRMIALFLKDAASYERCSNGTRHNNYWLLEIEGCHWMGHWMQCKKKNYLRLQSEYIERFYNVKFDAWMRETMQRNSINVFTERKRGVAMDEACKLFNAWLKTLAATPHLSVQCKRSTHLMYERKCSGSIFGVRERASNLGGSQYSGDMLKIESILNECDVFVHHGKVEMTEDYFWCHV